LSLPVGHVEEDINVAINTTEKFLARTHGEDGDISQGVNTLRLICRNGAIDEESILGVSWVDIVVGGVDSGSGWETWRGVNLVVFTYVRVGTNTLGESVTWVPAGFMC
jgi:hypothetical protein